MRHLARSIAILVALATIAVVAAPVLADDSDRAILSKKIGKYAPLSPLPGKNPCVCQDGSSDNGRAGYLTQLQQLAPPYGLLVVCYLQNYDGAGNKLGESACGTYFPLAK